VHALVDRNRIFIDRMRDVGTITTAVALDYGYTGPILRSTGAPRDLRKDTPYLAYAELDFDVPVASRATTTTATSCGCARWTSRST